ncbi:hypothetical protein LCGC14_1075920 [marine sediment metagenome]|uniref:Uncharacterized protein n=1 Tax=marine sediment metagenome TaxID=412755 RepID=A0A0F9PZV9_9ZZZZ
MTKADRDFVELTAELAATKAVNKMQASLECTSHGSDLRVMKSTMKDNKDHIEENREHGTNDRRMIISGIAILIIGEIVMKIFL